MTKWKTQRISHFPPGKPCQALMRHITPTEGGEGSSLPKLTVSLMGSKDYTQVSPEANPKDCIMEENKSCPWSHTYQ